MRATSSCNHILNLHTRSNRTEWPQTEPKQESMEMHTLPWIWVLKESCIGVIMWSKLHSTGSNFASSATNFRPQGSNFATEVGALNGSEASGARDLLRHALARSHRNLKPAAKLWTPSCSRPTV